MSAAQLLSGTGNPNGVAYGDPGDLYTDEAGSGFYFKATGVATNTGWISLSPGGDLGWYGTQIDGDLNFDGVSPVTINGVAVAPVGGVYTLPAPPGDVFCRNMSVAAVADVVTNGYRFYGKLLSITLGGHVSNNGSDGGAASNAGGGAGGAGGAGGTLLGGATGMNGSPGGGFAPQPDNSAEINSPFFPSRSTPSGGGAGGAGGGPASPGGVSSPQPSTGTYMVGTIALGEGTSGGSGGGSGGANADGNYAGGAGGGGGVMMLSFQTFNVPANAVRARGGAAGAGFSAGGPVGGSGGGQGGVVFVVTNDSVAPTCDVSGGAGGAGLNGGANGGNGDPGAVIAISPVFGPL